MSDEPIPPDSIFPQPDYGKGPGRKKEMPEGLWTKCPSCDTYLFNKELEANQMVCKACSHHFNISAKQRLHYFLDEESFQEHEAGVGSVVILKFTGANSYSEQLKSIRRIPVSRTAQ